MIYLKKSWYAMATKTIPKIATLDARLSAMAPQDAFTKTSNYKGSERVPWETRRCYVKRETVKYDHKMIL